jgi:hypothetical protein
VGEGEHSSLSALARGLKKNTHRLLVTSALANLFIARRHLLRCQGA